MAKKQKPKKQQEKNTAVDPLERVEKYYPAAPLDSTENETETYSTPVSPLGPPQPLGPTDRQESAAHPVPLPAQEADHQLLVKQLKQENRLLEMKLVELETAVKLSEHLQSQLDAEREKRVQAERQAAAFEAQIAQQNRVRDKLEAEQQQRLELEKRLAMFEVRAERAQEMAAQLTEERQRRIELEREKATLDVQVESLKKLDKLLAEERQARMNAQSRAASAEAQLARSEAEQGKQQNSGASSFLDRMRGR